FGLTTGTTKIPMQDIADVVVKIGVTRTEGSDGPGKPYHRIIIRKKDRTEKVAGKYIRDRGEGKRIAKEMNELIRAGSHSARFEDT
ncbi:MAG: hypothetical protein GTO08_03620, partial [Deltaproteobacteria bacterium]|nr:hypothetical protein [Deltaproteobacteria bacterium]